MKKRGKRGYCFALGRIIAKCIRTINLGSFLTLPYENEEDSYEEKNCRNCVCSMFGSFGSSVGIVGSTYNGASGFCNTKETFYREATVSAQKAAIQKPGVIDFVPLKSKSVLPFLKTKACVATVKKVETLYKKDSQENTYQACNLVELKVVKNIAGGFRKVRAYM